MVDILNEDFTTYEAYEPFLKKSVKEVPGGSVLQVQHVVNISVAKQDGPEQQQSDPDRQILKVTLTDGETAIYALVAEQIPRLGINTPPGTKIKIVQTVQTFRQIVMLTRANSLILGGNVPKLVDKWNLQRAMDVKKEWGAVGKGDANDDRLPLWRPCGQKSVSVDVTMLRKMKAMDIVNEKKEVAGAREGNQTQFDQQRQELVSELMENSARQKWQKPNKHLVSKEAQDIMDEGFTQEEATNALDEFKNPQKARRYLKANRGEYAPARKAPPEDRRDKRRKGKGRRGGDDEDDDAPIPKEFQRPTSNISLFGFIAGSMNIQGGGGHTAPELTDDTRREYDNYGHGRGRGTGRGGDHRGSRGARREGRSDTQKPDFSSYDNSPALGSTSFSARYNNQQNKEPSSTRGGYTSSSGSNYNLSRGGNSTRGGGGAYSSSSSYNQGGGGGGKSGQTSSYNNYGPGPDSQQSRNSSESQYFSSYRDQQRQLPSQDVRNYQAPPRFQFPPATDHLVSSNSRRRGGDGQGGSSSNNEYRNTSSSNWNASSSSIGPTVFTRGRGSNNNNPRGRGGPSSRGHY